MDELTVVIDTAAAPSTAAKPQGAVSEPNGKPYAMLLLLIAIWGSFAAINRLALNTLDVFQVTFFTFSIAFVSLALWMLAAKKFSLLRRIRSRQWVWLAILAVLSFLYYFLYSLSLSMTNPVTG